jgi:hypothetical protein
MDTPMVRVLKSSNSLDWDEMPLDKVPSGFVRVVIPGHGEFYSDPEMMQVDHTPKHPEFSPEVRAELVRLFGSFKGVLPVTFEQFEHGFRTNRYPWAEMATCEVISHTFTHFTQHLQGDDELTSEKRRDTYEVIRRLSFMGPAFPTNQPFRNLTAARVAEINAYTDTDKANALHIQASDKFRQLLKDLVASAGFPLHVPINALLDSSGFNTSSPFSAAECLGCAEIIVIRDVSTQQDAIAFGMDRIKAIIKSGKPQFHRTLTVSLDRESSELRTLLSAVAAVKGRHDFNGRWKK